MFKCVECGLEYKTKPDYCDCGNDIFELIDDISEEPEQVQNTTFNNPSPTYQEPFSYSGNSYYSKTQQSKIFEPISITIFSICILLAFLTIFVIGNPQKNAPVQNPNTAKTTQVTRT